MVKTLLFAVLVGASLVGCAAHQGGTRGEGGAAVAARLPENPELLAAVQNGDIDKVQALLAAGAASDSATAEGFTALHRAIVQHHNQIVRLLLERGANPNLEFQGSSPLGLARMSSNTEAHTLLLENGARYNESELAQAEVAKLGFKSYAEAFIDAVRRDDTSRIELVLTAGLPADKPLFNGIRPLHVAAADGTPATIRLLVARGADVNARTDRGAPVLWFARDRPANSLVLRELGAKEEP